MADNITLNLGSGGDVLSADDDGIAKHQRVKIEFGEDGTFTPVATSSPLPVGDAGGSLTVDNAQLVLIAADTADIKTAVEGTLDVNIVSGAGSGGTAMTDDAAFTPATTSGTPAFFMFDDVSPDSVNEGDAGIGRMSANRNQYVTIRDAAGNERGLNVDASGNITVNGTGTFTVANGGTFAVQMATNTPVGNVAHDAADSGAPVKVGFKAETSPKGITLVSDGDRADAYCDADGLLMVKLNTSGADVISEAVSNTDGASTAFTNFSAVVNTKNYITAYTAFRTDAGSSMAYIDLRDGTAGSVLWRIPLPPTGGAVSPPYNGPCLFKTSANTALAFDVSSALSTVYISVSGYQSKV